MVRGRGKNAVRVRIGLFWCEDGKKIAVRARISPTWCAEGKKWLSEHGLGLSGARERSAERKVCRQVQRVDR